MASSFPLKKNTATRIVFPILDADGDPVSSAAGLDSEYSLDGGAFSDCASEATEIGSSGIYYLDLAAGETNGDVVCIQVKTTTSGAKATVLVFYTSAQSLDTVDTNVDTIKTAIEHGTYGLSAIETLVDEAESLLKNATYGLSALKDIVEKIDDATDGLTAIKAEVEGLAGAAMRGTDNAALATALATVDTVVDAIKAVTDLLPDAGALSDLATALSELQNATYGLSAIETLVDELENRLTAARATNLDELGATNIPADIDALLTRLSATRAGYLDNLSAGAVALEATLTAIKGVGWTNETLKLIKELVDELETGEKPKPRANFRV